MANDDLNYDQPRNDPERNNFAEETAAEVVPVRPELEQTDKDRERGVDQEHINEDAENDGRGMGIFALILSLLSLLFLPVLLGAAGIIVGFVARRRGANALGNWAIAIGAISVVISLFLAPFF